MYRRITVSIVCLVAALATLLGAITPGWAIPPTGPGDIPDYFSTANWAFSPPLTKFIDPLPELWDPRGGGTAPDQCIPLAVPDTLTFPGTDYYEIALQQYSQKMHTDMPPTTLRGYVQLNSGTNAAGTANDVTPAPIRYLGPLIVAGKDRAVRIKFVNMLNPEAGTPSGKLFVPVDTTIMGSGEYDINFDPISGSEETISRTTGRFTENRATLHLHGGRTPWISDGTPHQWITPASETADNDVFGRFYSQGVSVVNVPDMPEPGDGSQTFYWTNQQSARLMFYHDHAWGITRLNVYVGEAAGYLITDEKEQDLIYTGTPVRVPPQAPGPMAGLGVGTPLVIQDKTFVDATTITATDPTWNWGTGAVNPGEITSITVNETGSNYTAPTVTITGDGGSGTGATATAIVEAVSGRIIGVTVTNGGAGYLSPVQVDITDGDGAGAMATATATDTRPPVRGDLWWPHVYMPAQNPYNPDFTGINAMGRWHYGPWFWPPTPLCYSAPLAVPPYCVDAVETANVYYDCYLAGDPDLLHPGDYYSDNGPCLNPEQPPYMPGTPNVSWGAEAFLDTMVVNGMAYPTYTVAAAPQRFRILNASHDRFLNLQLYKARPIISGITVTANGTGFTMPPVVTITGDGTGATAEATVSYGVITNAIVDDGGTGYTTASVTINGDGTGAAATATIVGGVITDITIDDGGYGYTTATIDITGEGTGALASAVIDPSIGAVTDVALLTVGSGYTTASVDITGIFGIGTGATASAQVYLPLTEVGMVPAAATPGFPALWPKDGREGGVPDPASAGPAFIQIGSEGGFLPAPVLMKNQPVQWNLDPTMFNVGNVLQQADGGGTVILGPAERADVIVDFSQYAGQTLILYNDAPTAFPALDPHYDYYTGAPDRTDIGASPAIPPGVGPNVRTVMQIKVLGSGGAAPANAFNAATLTALQTAFKSTPTTPGVFADAQDTVIVGQKEYGTGTGNTSAYNTTFPSTFPNWGVSRISDNALKFMLADLGVGSVAVTNGGLDYSEDFDIVFTGGSGTGAAARAIVLEGVVVAVNMTSSGSGYTTLPGVNFSLGSGTGATGVASNIKTVAMKPKAIHDEMGGTFDSFGRMSAKLGLEVPFSNAAISTFALQNYVDPPTEFLDPAVDPDGIQIWKITHNGVDTHPIHFHLFDVQLINRVGWDGFIRKPDPNELGWKDTVRMAPLEDTIVALRPITPTMPFGLPNSRRPLNPETYIGSTMGFSNIDPATGNALGSPVENRFEDFDWEYVWHCHILSHEENDMMRPMVYSFVAMVPAAPVLNAVDVGSDSLLTWTDTTPVGLNLGDPANEIGFRIERSVNGDAYLPLATLLANETSFTDINPPLTTLAYRILAFNVAGESAWSNIVSLTAPTAPVSLVATAISNVRVDLAWTDTSNNEAGFAIERAPADGAFVQVGTAAANATTYSDLTVVGGTAYRFRVIAFSNRGVSAPSDIASATTLRTAPMAISPSGSGISTTPTYTFTAMAGATGYQLHVYNNGTWTYSGFVSPSTANCPSGTGDCTINQNPATPLLPGASQWQVQANYPAGTSIYCPVMVFTVGTLPLAPTPISPAGVIIDTTPTYSFTAVAGATFYRIRLYINGVWTYDVWVDPTTALCPTGTGNCFINQNPATPLPPGTFYWQVQAQNVSGVGPLSTNTMFTVGTLPGAPTPNSPIGVGISTTPTYSFTAVTGATFYRLRVYNNGAWSYYGWVDPTAALCPSGTGNCTIYQNPAAPLLPGTSYWQVQAQNTSGVGPLSTNTIFTVGTPPPAPTPISPALLATTSTTPTYTFTAVPGATFYRLRLLNNGVYVYYGWVNPTTALCPTGLGSCTINQNPATPLVPGASYWQVQAQNASGTSPLSSSTMFTVE